MKRTILIIDDSGFEVEMVAFFREKGYEVILATSPIDAHVALFAEKRIDFVISAGLRWKMAYKLALERFGYVNVVIFTGSPEVVKSELGDRPAFIIGKPLPLPDLYEHVGKVCPPN